MINLRILLPQKVKLYRIMQNLLEAEEVSEQILTKLVHDYITRYSLKQQIAGHQFTNDTNQFLSELQLYSKSVRQVRKIGQHSGGLEECLQKCFFRVMAFFVRIVHKLLGKNSKNGKQEVVLDNRCMQCYHNINAKRIQQVKRQMIDHLPILARADLEEQDQSCDTFEEDILTEQHVIKKIVKLQKNLHEKQLGLMRCIDEFQDFRGNLMVGRPKYNDKDLNDKFDAKKYVLQLGSYFSNNLQNIQEKINLLKASVKQTQDFGVQCFGIEQAEQEKEAKSLAQSTRVTNIKNQTEIRRLNEANNKLQETLKIYSIQVKHLSSKVAEIDQQNVDLKQQIFIEKMKVKARDKNSNKPSSLLQDQQLLKRQENTDKSISSLESEIAHDIHNQLAARKKQIQEFGIQIQQVVPYIKKTFKKSLDNMLKKRTSLIQKKRKIDQSEDDSSLLLNASKKNRASIRGIGNSLQKRQNGSRFQVSAFKGEKQKKSQYGISVQISYKIVGAKKPSKMLYSHSGVNPSEDKNTISQHQTRNSRFLYKQSSLQTEGNSNLKKKGMHIKLSSIASDVKDSVNTDSDVQINESGATTSPISGFYNSQKGKSHERSDSQLLKIGSGGYEELFDQVVDKGRQKRQRQSKMSVLSMRSQTMSGLMKQRNGTEKVKNLIQIRRLQGSRTIDPEVLSQFLQPQYQKETNAETCQASVCEDSGKDYHTGIKSIFNRLKSNEKMQTLNKAVKGLNSTNKIKPLRKQPLTLQQISFLTGFFTLMARSHLVNQNLYLQLRQCILETSKENSGSTSKKEQAMIKQIIGQVILKHRRCAGKGICPHLTSFLQQFNNCLQ